MVFPLMSFVNPVAYLCIHDICIQHPAGINCNIYLLEIIQVWFYTSNCSMETVEKIHIALLLPLSNQNNHIALAAGTEL